MPKKNRQRFCYDYPRPAVTADVVIVTKDRRRRVLLIRRKHAPFAGLWALPGGFVNEDEGLETAARRELREETGLDTGRIEQLAAFGDPGRDPRGHTVTIAFLAQVDAAQLRPVAADDAADVAWFPLS
ncbi:MAG TPA: NUDIX hydrolase, partial [Gemmataceae bacterium]|nr:NUDIX hydrolase [Gemmataceae bacterium]